MAIADQAATYDSLVKSGKVHNFAPSNYTTERIREWLEYATANSLTLPAVIQPQCNLVHRFDFEQSYSPLAKEYGIATFTYFALASDFRIGKYRSAADLEGQNRAGFVVVDMLLEIAESRGVEPATVALAWQLA